MRNLPRILLAFSALILAAGGLMHAAAFDKTLSAVDASNLPGNFVPAHMLLASAVAAVLAGLRLQSRSDG